MESAVDHRRVEVTDAARFYLVYRNAERRDLLGVGPRLDVPLDDADGVLPSEQRDGFPAPGALITVIETTRFAASSFLFSSAIASFFPRRSSPIRISCMSSRPFRA
jgi:hypothetical protein